MIHLRLTLIFPFLYFFREYYFSRENLQKDFFLRRKMDEDGFLPVTLVASFNRVRSLTSDVAFIVETVKVSDIVEIIDGKVDNPKPMK